jgi:nitrogen fixation protein FixH
MKTLIAVVTVIGLAAVVGSIIVGLSSFDGTVTDNPYEEGLRWDNTRKSLDELGWRVRLEGDMFYPGDNEMTLSVMDRNNRPVDAEGITVMRSRPSSAEYDAYFMGTELKKGVYRVTVHFPVYGVWDIKVFVPDRGRALMYEERLFVEKGGERR